MTKQAAMERHRLAHKERDQPIQPNAEEAFRWSFELLQYLREGRETDALIGLIGRTRVAYPLRIYRIASDMGFLVKDSGKVRNNIREACITIGRAIRELQGESVKSNESYLKVAWEWLKGSKRGDISPASCYDLAESLFEEDLFREGLKIVGGIDPDVLRRYSMLDDRPANRRPDYPLHFLLFALNKFLETEKKSKYFICRILSAFLKEQKITVMTYDAIAQALKRQQSESVEELKRFYDQIINAYLWPYLKINSFSRGFDGTLDTRILIENPDPKFPCLSILMPDWDDAFPE